MLNYGLVDGQPQCTAIVWQITGPGQSCVFAHCCDLNPGFTLNVTAKDFIVAC